MPGPTLRLRPNAERANQAIYALYFLVAVQAGLVLSSLSELYLLHRIAADDIPDPTLINLADTIFQGLIAAYLLGLVIAATTFIRWFRRAYYNLHELPVRVDHGEGWAAGAWFVPFLNLVRPYQIMQELYVKSDHLLRGHPLAEGLLGKRDTIGIWWGMWVIFSILSRVVARMSDNLDTIEAMQTSFQLDVVLYTWGLPTAYLAILVVKRYSAIEWVLRTVFTPEETLIVESFGPRER
ncbi:uncharacterized protein DUF4328 [Neolewinella xylanilytica]|uniref:Uncharacterized protein DUF4328 n=1 Tax=Neolewinella xylanilytica TaxID=1514080 RepID=A0A2S6IB47_9BACT|nr:DUF4328 domain-containing protein [Neolewinella xylanilytica]PPK88737.1 uncharacterized protein DUF4328 [Neolewinella xylanilytica]